MNRSTTAFLYLALSLAAAACSVEGAPAADRPAPDASGPEVPAADGSVADASAADASVADASLDSGRDGAVDAGPCNLLVDTAAPVVVQAVASDAPTPSGGTIADGAYVLTRAVLYTGPAGAAGPTGQTIAVTIRINGGAAESVTDGVARSATIAESGSLLRTTNTCPGTDVQQFGFAASAGTLVVFIPNSSGTLVETFRAQ